MHLVNRVLSLFSLKLTKADPPIGRIDQGEKEFKEKYELGFKQAKKNRRGFEVSRVYRNDVGIHPRKQQDLELEFSAYHLHQANPLKIIDIGSYRDFILGLLAHYDVTTVDVRKRQSLLDNETPVTCDAKALTFPNDFFDAVLSIQCLPHIGLGRYGDPIDLDADINAFTEMVRVLKPGGIFIFSTAITGGKPTIAWNARRNYSYKMIREFCNGLELVEEKFIDRQNISFCTREELTTDPNLFNYYVSCWKK